MFGARDGVATGRDRTAAFDGEEELLRVMSVAGVEGAGTELVGSGPVTAKAAKAVGQGGGAKAAEAAGPGGGAKAAEGAGQGGGAKPVEAAVQALAFGQGGGARQGAAEAFRQGGAMGTPKNIGLACWGKKDRGFCGLAQSSSSRCSWAGQCLRSLQGRLFSQAAMPMSRSCHCHHCQGGHVICLLLLLAQAQAPQKEHSTGEWFRRQPPHPCTGSWPACAGCMFPQRTAPGAKQGAAHVFSKVLAASCLPWLVMVWARSA